MCSLLLDMKIPSIRQQGLERVLGTKYLSATFLENIVKSVKEQLTSTQGRKNFRHLSMIKLLFTIVSHLCLVQPQKIIGMLRMFYHHTQK